MVNITREYDYSHHRKIRPNIALYPNGKNAQDIIANSSDIGFVCNRIFPFLFYRRRVAGYNSRQGRWVIVFFAIYFTCVYRLYDCLIQAGYGWMGNDFRQLVTDELFPVTK